MEFCFRIQYIFSLVLPVKSVRNVTLLLSTTGVVVVLGFYVSKTAKVIRRRDFGLKSHPKYLSTTNTGVFKALATTSYASVVYHV